MDIRKDLMSMILLTGGNASIPGFCDRLTAELKNKFPPSMIFKITNQSNAKYGVWYGGSHLASLSTFQSSWISKEEYDEYGPNIVHRKGHASINKSFNYLYIYTLKKLTRTSRFSTIVIG